MQFREYEESAAKTAIYPITHRVNYPVLGLNGEAGEIAEKYKKVIRDSDGKLTPQDKSELLKEAGDVLWYLTALCHDLGFTLEEAAKSNMEKLDSRQRRGKLGGSGDNR